ncbi:hypothetical protein LXA43DRAFT_1102000 [Ganoderma leucocontextum]|nr:hypothetical protein LXA43DRAFT_1102000 [Ganoderma leucocontextum]
MSSIVCLDASAAPKVATPVFLQRRFTRPLKDSYECPTCNKVLEIQTLDDEKRGYISGCKYVQCTHANTEYEEWPKKFQWVTEWYWPTSDDDDDQEPAASEHIDSDNIAVYRLGMRSYPIPDPSYPSYPGHPSYPVSPFYLVRSLATLDTRPVDEHTQPSKKRKQELQAGPVKRRRVEVIDLTLSPGSSQDLPIDLDEE